MKSTSLKRAPKSLSMSVSDLVAEGGNILASDDAATLAVIPAKGAVHAAMSSKRSRRPRIQQRAKAAC